MPKITFLPNEDICPDGAVIEAPKGTSICRAALDTEYLLSMHASYRALVRPVMYM